MIVTLIQKIKRTIEFEVDFEAAKCLGYENLEEMAQDLRETDPHEIVELLKGEGLDPEVTDNLGTNWYSPSDDIFLESIE